MSINLEKDAAWHASYLRLLFIKIFNRVPQLPPRMNLSGKTVLITGASSGMGLECARQLLDSGLDHLIIAARSQQKLDVAASELRARAPKANIEVWLVDMGLYSSVQAFAKRCHTLPRLDIALLNAGIARLEFERAEETEHEYNLQVNYLSTILLAILLLPKLRASANPDGTPGRLSLVSSGLALTTGYPDIPEGEYIKTMDHPKTPFNGTDRYSQSKLMLVMFVAKLASEIVSADDVVINTINTSLVKGTDNLRDTKGLLVVAEKVLLALIGRELPEGGRILTYSSAVLGKECHGSYTDWIVRPYPPMMYKEIGRKRMERVWNETMKELEFAGVQGILDELKQ